MLHVPFLLQHLNMFVITFEFYTSGGSTDDSTEEVKFLSIVSTSSGDLNFKFVLL